MNQSTLQSLIALVINTKRELVCIKDIMVGEGEIHFELAEPLSPLGKLNFKKLNLTLNEIRKLDKKIERLNNILPELKKELKREVARDNNRKGLSNSLVEHINAGIDTIGSKYSQDSYRIGRVEIDGRELTEEEAFKVAGLNRY